MPQDPRRAQHFANQNYDRAGIATHYPPHHPSLPSYPSYPHPGLSSYGTLPPSAVSAPLSSASSIPEGFVSCASCGVPFPPRYPEHGVLSNALCPTCYAQRQHQQQQQQHVRRVRNPATTPMSPSKRGSWHSGVDYPVSPSSSSSSSAAYPRHANSAETGNMGSGDGYPAISGAPTNAVPYASPYSYPPIPPAHDPSSSSSGIASASEPSKFDSLRRTAGSIIKEKDAVIEKQRHQIQQLEQLARQAQLQSSEMTAKQVGDWFCLVV